jgi:predicted nucleotidyltransferase
MDARPLLIRIAKMLEQHGLEVVLIGNAAAALQGAPVTTVDFDFMFRKTPVNLRKLKALAKALDAVILRPYYPASDLFRIVRDDDGLQIDFMATVHGVRSLATLRSRAKTMAFGEARLLVASLSDIIRSKRAAGRPRDLAVLQILERSLHEEEARDPKGKTGSP